MSMRLLVLVPPIASLALAGCAGDDALRQRGADVEGTAAPAATASSGLPGEFRPACGKPGAEVVTERLEVRIKHIDCDLTGVTIVHEGRGALVPEPGMGVGSSAGVSIEVDAETRDVTFTAEAEVPQY